MAAQVRETTLVLARPPAHDISVRPLAIEVERLSKRFGDVEAVRPISFAVSSGEMLGFLGPNGAGKSTRINMLCTLVRPTGGSARVAGCDIVSQQTQVR